MLKVAFWPAGVWALSMTLDLFRRNNQLGFVSRSLREEAKRMFVAPNLRLDATSNDGGLAEDDVLVVVAGMVEDFDAVVVDHFEGWYEDVVLDSKKQMSRTVMLLKLTAKRSKVAWWEEGMVEGTQRTYRRQYWVQRQIL